MVKLMKSTRVIERTPCCSECKARPVFRVIVENKILCLECFGSYYPVMAQSVESHLHTYIHVGVTLS